MVFPELGMVYQLGKVFPELGMVFSELRMVVPELGMVSHLGKVSQQRYLYYLGKDS